MHVFLFVFYFILLCVAIVKIPFFRNSEIRLSFLLSFFTLRILISCLHVWTASRYFPDQGDSWGFFGDSLLMKRMLLTHPIDFIRTLFPPVSDFSFFDSHSPWYALQFRFIAVINMVLDFFSFNNFYINSLFFSFLVFWGNIALFRVVKEIFHNNGLLCALLTLVLPSTLFWTACINKEAVIFMSLGFMCYYIHQALTEAPSARIILSAALFLLIPLCCRSNLLFGLLPALLFWMSGEKIHISVRWLMILTIGFLCSIYYVINLSSPGGFDIFQILSERQSLFFEQTGRSRIPLPEMNPSPAGFLSILPTAFTNGFLQPLPGPGRNPFYLLFTVEIAAVMGTILLALSRRFVKTSRVRMGVFDIFCLFLAIPCILVIGLTVPFAGAIVRYRSIFLPFLLVPFVHTLSGIPFVNNINRNLSKMLN